MAEYLRVFHHVGFFDSVTEFPLVVNTTGWIVLGVITGLTCGTLSKSGGRDWRDVTFGVIGAVSGGWILTAIGVTDVMDFNVWSQAAAMIGATTVLVVRHSLVAVVGLVGLLLMVWDGIGGVSLT